MIIYKNDKQIDPDLLFDLYRSIDWADDSQYKKTHGELIARVYANSSDVVSAWEDDKLVGVARVVTDKFAHAILYGLCVYPEFMNSEVPENLINKCIGLYPKIQWSVVAEDWEKKYFDDLGFTQSKNTCLEKGDCPI